MAISYRTQVLPVFTLRAKPWALSVKQLRRCARFSASQARAGTGAAFSRAHQAMKPRQKATSSSTG